jgi:hypothetical protein
MGTEGVTMDQEEKVRENRLRRMAERQGLALLKSRRRDPRAIDYDCWAIVDSESRVTRGRPILSLGEVEAALESAPIVELRHAWRAYLGSRDEASRAVVRGLVREVTTLGLPLEAAASAAGIPPEDIGAPAREVEHEQRSSEHESRRKLPDRAKQGCHARRAEQVLARTPRVE